MHVHFGLDHLVAEWPEALVCIGTFDGVHLGHREVIRRSVQKARGLGIPCVLVTFDRHPAAILAPEKAPLAIGSIEGNLAEFESLGVDVALVLPFTRSLADTTAEEFYQRVLVQRIGAKSIVIGHDFAFGHDRQGTPEWLQERIETEVVPAFLVEGERVSSRMIRQAVSDGQVEYAAQLLGRPFAISGVVVHGEKIGRQLGYPTANIARSFRQVMPANGIYSGDFIAPFGIYRAAISVGVRPTFNGTTRTVEAFLINYEGEEFYGQSATLTFVKRIRDEQRFESVDLLKEQMARDVEVARG